ncbi:MAG TPA: TlpA disulfide reductase family protein [Planctomycetota bacterium]|nr:TlpA disulfide reductase family protein [Planctomycetota bacterium]
MRKVDAGPSPTGIARRLALALLIATACGGGFRVEVVTLDGVDAAVAARRGNGILLNFWAIWCPPCVAELPALAKVAGEFAGRGTLLGVSYDLMIEGAKREEVSGQVREFLARKGLAFDVLVYDALDYDSINARFSLPGEIPVTLAFDREGRIVDRQEGPGDEGRFREMMRRALGE